LSAIASDTVLAVFLIFCRFGACLMLMPGFSSSRIPPKVRLGIAVSTTLALSPLLIGETAPLTAQATPSDLLRVIGSELLVGFLIGLMGRLFFLALQTISVSIAQAIGLGGIPGLGVDEDTQLPPIASLFSLTAVTLMFITNQHWLILGSLVDSYSAIPADSGFNVQTGLIDIVDQTTAVFVLALRIGSPFIIYSIIVNFAVGITNKLSPQIPVFFIAMPFVTAGGLILLVLTAQEFMASFIGGLQAWLLGG